MKIFFTILVFTCCITKSYAQNYFPYKAPKQNVAWIDSMKRIVAKGFEVDEKKKNNWKKQLSYINTCALLGRYYEWAYEKRYVKNMNKALVYYRKVIDLPRFPDDEKYFKALAIRTNIFRKLEDIYFKGKGVKKNKEISFQYALQGIGYNKKLIEFYSVRYFDKNSKMIYADKNLDKLNDTVFVFKANPFSTTSKRIYLNQLDNNLKNIAEIFKAKLKLDSSLYLLVEMRSEMSSRDQSDSNHCLNYIIENLIDKQKIDENLINGNLEVRVIDKVFFTIFIK